MFLVLLVLVYICAVYICYSLMVENLSTEVMGMINYGDNFKEKCISVSVLLVISSLIAWWGFTLCLLFNRDETYKYINLTVKELIEDLDE